MFFTKKTHISYLVLTLAALIFCIGKFSYDNNQIKYLSQQVDQEDVSSISKQKLNKLNSDFSLGFAIIPKESSLILVCFLLICLSSFKYIPLLKYGLFNSRSPPSTSLSLL